MRIFTIATLLIISLGCTDETVDLLPTVTKNVSDLYAPTTSQPGSPPSGILFCLFDGWKQVFDNSWDLAFRGTTILINGGIREQTMSQRELVMVEDMLRLALTKI